MTFTTRPLAGSTRVSCPRRAPASQHTAHTPLAAVATAWARPGPVVADLAIPRARPTSGTRNDALPRFAPEERGPSGQCRQGDAEQPGRRRDPQGVGAGSDRVDPVAAELPEGEPTTQRPTVQAEHPVPAGRPDRPVAADGQVPTVGRHAADDLVALGVDAPQGPPAGSLTHTAPVVTATLPGVTPSPPGMATVASTRSESMSMCQTPPPTPRTHTPLGPSPTASGRPGSATIRRGRGPSKRSSRPPPGGVGPPQHTANTSESTVLATRARVSTGSVAPARVAVSRTSGRSVRGRSPETAAARPLSGSTRQISPSRRIHTRSMMRLPATDSRVRATSSTGPLTPSLTTDGAAPGRPLEAVGPPRVARRPTATRLATSASAAATISVLRDGLFMAAHPRSCPADDQRPDPAYVDGWPHRVLVLSGCPGSAPPSAFPVGPASPKAGPPTTPLSVLTHHPPPLVRRRRGFLIRPDG